MSKNLYIVHYSFEIPVLADDAGDAVMESFDFAEDALLKAKTSTKRINKPDDLSHDMKGRVPANAPTGPTCLAIAQQKLDEDTNQLKLFS